MGTDPANPSPHEPSLSNQTRFSHAQWTLAVAKTWGGSLAWPWLIGLTDV
jgi:hypothetical protein